MCLGKKIISKYYLNRFMTLTNKGWVHLIPLKFPRVPKKIYLKVLTIYLHHAKISSYTCRPNVNNNEIFWMNVHHEIKQRMILVIDKMPKYTDRDIEILANNYMLRLINEN